MFYPRASIVYRSISNPGSMSGDFRDEALYAALMVPLAQLASELLADGDSSDVLRRVAEHVGSLQVRAERGDFDRLQASEMPAYNGRISCLVLRPPPVYPPPIREHAYNNNDSNSGEGGDDAFIDGALAVPLTHADRQVARMNKNRKRKRKRVSPVGADWQCPCWDEDLRRVCGRKQSTEFGRTDKANYTRSAVSKDLPNGTVLRLCLACKRKGYLPPVNCT